MKKMQLADMSDEQLVKGLPWLKTRAQTKFSTIRTAVSDGYMYAYSSLSC